MIEHISSGIIFQIVRIKSKTTKFAKNQIIMLRILIPGLFGLLVCLSSCSKDQNEIELIETYLEDNNLNAQMVSPGLYIITINKGQDPFPNASSNVTAHYHGYLLNGQVFDSSVERGTPLTISLTQVIQGWREGIPNFGTGGKGSLIMTSELAYGSRGSGIIPPNTPIAFDIELISVNN